MSRGIACKFVRQVSLPTLNDLFREDSQIKVVKISNCMTTCDATKVLSDQNFRKWFEKDQTCFVIIFEIEENLTDVDNLDIEASKPMIVAFESKYQNGNFAIFCKEANEKILKRIINQNCSPTEWMVDGLNVSFSVEVLLQALSVGNGGSFNGKLLETTLNADDSCEDMRFIDRAAFHNNVLCLKFLRLFDSDLSTSNAQNRKLFEIVAKSCDFQGFTALLDLPNECDSTQCVQAVESFEVLQARNSKLFNMLMIASASGNADGVKFLLKCNYDINQQREVNETAASLAWKNENYEIFVHLLKENSLFPKNFLEKFKEQKERGKAKCVLMFINDLNLLHANVRRGRIDEVEGFLEKYPSTRHAYNVRNESAAAIAIKSEQFAMYEFLITQGICLGPHEDIGEILNSQRQTDCHDDRRTMMKKILLHELHKKYFKQSLDKHLMTLLAHSDIGFDTPSTEKRSLFKYIKEAYESLDRIQEVSAILKIVSKANSFRIVFDFNRNAVNFLDPLTCRDTKGTSYSRTGYIYVGAKGLLSDRGKFEVLGILAHELTHYAMQLVYENNCKPYRDHDIDTLRDFEIISTYCEFYKTKEDKILNVFSYPKAQQHAELIVRVPHLLAMHMNDPEKLQECRKTFENLFDFFASKTLIDVANEQPLMLAKRETVELNDWLGVHRCLLNLDISLKPDNMLMNFIASGKVGVIVSNCIRLTVKAIHLQLQRDMKTRVESFFIFARLDAIENEKTKLLLIKALKLTTRPTIIFECPDNALLEEVIFVVDALKAQQRVIFVVKEEDDNRFQQKMLPLFNIHHAWEDFSVEAQGELWTYNVTFQGKTLTLRELMKIPSKAVEAIPFCDLLGRRLTVMEPLEFKEIDFFIERKFLKESEEHSFESMEENAKDKRIVLISDDPGAGKTTTFKTFAMKLKDKHPEFWVSYLDLKQLIDVFEQNQQLDFCTIPVLADFLAGKIFRLATFELELFRQLFADNRLILLLDGIDEICPNYKDFILKLMKTIRNLTTNQLWISTRPHLAFDLAQELDTVCFHLKPFRGIEQRNFYYKFYERRNVPSGDLDRYVKGIEKLMSFLNQNRLFWSTITNEIISNPLFMRIAAEIYDDDVMQQSKNGKCLTLCNLYLMYERFIEKKFSLWMTKGRLSITDQIDIHRSSKSVMRCHLRLALEKIFNDSKVKTLVEEPQLTTEQITRVGLVSFDGSELQFLHRTFAEFFVADFLFRKVLCSEICPVRPQRPSRERRIIMRLFVRVLTSDEFQMIRAFLGNAIELVKHNKDTKKFARLARLFCRESRRSERDKILMVAVNDGCVNLTTLVLEISIATECVLLKLVNREKRDLQQVLMNSLRIHRKNVETVKSLWEAATKVYDERDVKTLLLKLNSKGESLLHITARCDTPQLIEFLLTEVRKVADEEEFKEFLILPDKSGRNAMQTALEFNETPLALETIWRFFEEAFAEDEQIECLRKIIVNPSDIFQSAIANDEKVFQEFWQILLLKLDENELKEILNGEI